MKAITGKSKLLALSFAAVLLAAAVQLAVAAALRTDGSGLVGKGASEGGGIQSVYLSGELQALSQAMINHSLLAALKVDPAANIRRLTEEREHFVRILNALRHGDSKADLRGATNPEILKKLDRLAKEWSIFGPVIESIIETKKVTPHNVAIVAECIEPLVEATDELIAVFEYFATGGRFFSVLTGMISTAETQRARLKEMTASYLLIAYGHQPEIYRAKLWAYQHQFDQILSGLSDGNRQLKLLPPPNRELGKQLHTARQIWEQISPVIRAVAHGSDVDPNSIPPVVRQSDLLAAKIGRAVEMYKLL